MPSEVSEPPTNSTAAGVPETFPVVVAVPVKKVWMSPVSETMFSTPAASACSRISRRSAA